MKSSPAPYIPVIKYIPVLKCMYLTCIPVGSTNKNTGCILRGGCRGYIRQPLELKKISLMLTTANQVISRGFRTDCEQILMKMNGNK